MNIERIGPGDEDKVGAIEDLLDGPVKADALERFLNDPNHHLLIAYADGEAVGFVSGVEMTHPDKGTEMFLYELGVADRHRRQGVATALVEGLKELAREKQCYGMWVLCDEDNEPAVKTYGKVGGNPSKPILFDWELDS